MKRSPDMTAAIVLILVWCGCKAAMSVIAFLEGSRGSSPIYVDLLARAEAVGVFGLILLLLMVIAIRKMQWLPGLIVVFVVAGSCAIVPSPEVSYLRGVMLRISQHHSLPRWREWVYSQELTEKLKSVWDGSDSAEIFVAPPDFIASSIEKTYQVKVTLLKNNARTLEMSGVGIAFGNGGDGEKRGSVRLDEDSYLYRKTRP